MSESPYGSAVLPVVHKPGCGNPDVRAHCECGENRSCVTCGWGSGSSPCTCERKRRDAQLARDGIGGVS